MHDGFSCRAYETAADTLTWWAWCMAANSPVQLVARRKVDTVLQRKPPTAQDLSALPYFTQPLQETLRLYPAAPALVTRRSLRTIIQSLRQLTARTVFVIRGSKCMMTHDDFRTLTLFARSAFATTRPISREALSCQLVLAHAWTWGSI